MQKTKANYYGRRQQKYRVFGGGGDSMKTQLQLYERNVALWDKAQILEKINSFAKLF